MNDLIKRIADEDQFYFLKLQDLFENFKNYKINYEDLDYLIKQVHNQKKFSFSDFLNNNSKYNDFILMMGKIIATSDYLGYNKNNWNLYEDKRVIGKPFVRQDDWVKNLLLFKRNNNIDDMSAESIKNTIKFIMKPEANLAQLSINHRKKTASNLLKTTYNEQTFYDDVYNYYADKIKYLNIRSKSNLGYILSILLYEDRDKWDYDINKNNFIGTQTKKKNLNNPEVSTNYKTKNIILYGVPGVGKTHNVKNIISMYESGIDEKEIFAKIEENAEFSDNVELPNDRVEFITFHQSFAYEDFVEGFRPDDSGKIVLQDGIFKNICDKARDDKENNYYLVIDEINRGNISKIFGELITLIEEDKREVFEVKLPYSKKSFSIPKNLFIIATMNSTDKSIALIDIALRRRFTFLKLEPNLELIEWEKARELLKKLNESLDSERVIGHSYFMDVTNQEDLEFVLRYKITPLLEEYFYGDENKLDEIKVYMR